MANFFDQFDTPKQKTTSNFFDQFDETKTISTPQTQTVTTEKNFFDQFDKTPETAPVETSEKIDEDELDNNQEWLKNALLIYQAEEGEDWKRSTKELSEWFKDRHSKLNWDITNKIKTTLKESERTDEVERAWRESTAQYGNTKNDAGQFGRGFYHAITDPIGIASLIPSIIAGAAGSVAGPAGTVGGVVATQSLIRGSAVGVAKWLGKTLYKNNLKEQLVKRKISESVADKIVKGEVVRGVKKSVIKKARNDAAKATAKRSATLAGIEGGSYTTIADVADQAFELGLDIDTYAFIDAVNQGYDYDEAAEIAKKTDFDLGRLAIAAGVGTVFGGTIGGLGGLANKLGNKRALQRIAEGPDEDVVKVSEAKLSLGMNDSANTINTKARQTASELEEGGEVVVDLGATRKDISNIIKDMKKSDEWKKMTPKQKNKWVSNLKEELKNKEKVTKEQFAFNNIELQPVKGKKGQFTGRKIVEEFKEEGTTQLGDARKVGEKVVGKLKGEFFDDAGGSDLLKGLRTKKDSALNAVADKVRTRLKRYNKLLKEEYGVTYKNITPQLNRTLDNVFRGDADSIAKVSKEAPKLFREIQEMRNDIKFLQKDLLKSGAIKEGSELDIKIVKSMEETGKPELYVTRKYQMHDNPKWTKFLNKTTEGQDILTNARSFILNQAGSLKEDLGIALEKNAAKRTRVEQELIDSYTRTDGYVDNVITDILKMNDESDLKKVFESRGLYENASNILKGRKSIPDEIRALMGEYDNPISNYSNTAMKLFQTVEDYKYEKAIVDAISEGKISGAALEKQVSRGITTPLESSLPQQVAGVTDELTERGLAKPLQEQGVYGTKEIAAFIANGNEMSVDVPKFLQTYLMLQGHSRAAKTIWSAATTARNFISAGWMAIGAGYMNPRYLKEIPKVFKGMYLKSDPALNIDREKGMLLGIIQSGTDLGSFRGAMRDAGETQFWDLTSPLYKGGQSLIDRAKRANTTAAKFYQSMDDMWKQFAFMNEKGNYRQILIDQGIDPDEVSYYINKNGERVKREYLSGDGIKFEITRLDEIAAENVNKHMQNYAGVPKFIRRMRLLPFADFLAFKSEIIRTQKNIIKSAITDIRDGNAMIRMGERNADGSIKGAAQRNLGIKRLGSIVAAQGSAPALALTSAQLWGMNEVEEGTDTVKQGVEAFEESYNKGANFFYMGKPDKKGRGRRINISYLNPWSPTQDPIMAGIRALNTGEYVEGAVDEAFNRVVINPLKEAFAPSMVLQAVSQFMSNVDDYGRPIFSDTELSTGENIANGMKVFLQAFEPGGVKSVRDIVQSYNLSDYGKDFGVSRGGRERYQDDSWIALSGVKPERYDVGQSLAFKLSGLKNDMGDTNKIFERAYRQRSPITVDELVDAYSEGMEKQYAIATQMFDYISKARSAGLDNTQIVKSITDNGLFTTRLDKKILYNMVNKGVFVPPQPLTRDVFKWGVSTQKRTGQKPPIREAQKRILETYRSYVGSRTGER